ncbi:hypothetical protein AUEXF2481DRAFT_84195 [Aureobasidium subglaciale EXF-2481]|uniref:F-box domain-containing protein n=1 Tax=Aureobasidium subglaciale (strain EXF-2481) TaxID=1043005 RepID=A0A074YQL8_AURSE|nr:uncharacterized protein AUEXF2481DRAFT_84195 [Aureobasidium subglaciale EXF-2481]KER00059.1 hypothetical protein AUEXF2481DRAFT_84195 [Aureobasidium subglaciale EXF-2481]
MACLFLPTSLLLIPVAEIERQYVHKMLRDLPLEILTLIFEDFALKPLDGDLVEVWLQAGTLEHILTDHVPEDKDEESFPTSPFLEMKHLAKLDITAQERESWFYALSDIQEDADVALLFTLITHVEHMELVMPNYDSEDFARPTSPPSFIKTLSYLRHLTSVHVYPHWNDEYFYELDNFGLDHYQGYPLSIVLPLLSLHFLYAARFEWPFEVYIQEQDGYTSTQSFSTTLKSLQSHSCAVHPRILENLLSRCTVLKTLGYDIPKSDWNLQHIKKIIYSHHHSLESLSMKRDIWHEWGVSTEPRGLTLKNSPSACAQASGFLHNYASLTTLDSNERLLHKLTPGIMSQDFLSNQLQHLRISLCSDGIMLPLEKLLQQDSELIRQLKSVMIDDWEAAYYSKSAEHNDRVRRDSSTREQESADRMKKLGGEFTTAGIKFPVDHYEKVVRLIERMRSCEQVSEAHFSYTRISHSLFHLHDALFSLLCNQKLHNMQRSQHLSQRRRERDIMLIVIDPQYRDHTGASCVETVPEKVNKDYSNHRPEDTSTTPSSRNGPPLTS